MTKIAYARRSQLLSTYGIGGLFPSENTSFMIMGLDDWSPDRATPVSEPRLARSLGVSALHAPPAGSKRDIPVIRFPDTQICPRCRRIGNLRDFNCAWNEVECRLCGRKEPLTPSRLIVACTRGHVDEFPYFRWLHLGQSGLPGKHEMKLESKGRTSSLADMQLSCTCGVTPTGLDGTFDAGALKGITRCQGRRPWLGAEHTEECAETPRTLQRGASNVWFPAVRSTISIPPFSEAVAKFVDREWSILKNPEALDTDWLIDSIVAKALGRFSKEDILTEARRRHAADVVGEELTEESLRRDEFKALMEGREESGAGSDFVSLPRDVPNDLSSFVSDLRKVTRLREVRALYGFSRLTAIGGGPEVDGLCALSSENPTWLPAIEVIGEGVFMALPREKLGTWAARSFATNRQRILQGAANRAAEAYGRPEPVKIDIVRVAVHTLAHVLIDQVALDAGYPAASIRERLFVDDTMAGILVYTATSDSAGSLGGVAAHGEPEKFGQAMAEGLRRLSWCSSDPVCIESLASGTDALNLAACHACVLVPETSCELNNSFLDRALLFGTQEDDFSGGFFSELVKDLSTI